MASRGVLIAALALGAVATPRAQPPAPAHRDITYIMPIFPSIPDAATMNDFKTSIGEGPYVRVGFSYYIPIEMTDWNVDTNSPAAVRAALASTFANIDAKIQRGIDLGVPVSLNMVTATRAEYDAVQTASELEDRRSMQWYMDNTVANGWWSHSRYARKARAVQEAYVREVGRYLARKMNEFPTVLVSAAGDGEVEMSYVKSYIVDGVTYPNEADALLTDYSPFATAEFRDWLRNGGLYGPGQRYAGEGYALAARYEGDLTPGADTNTDGHTLNGDFGTTFTTWNLRIAEWQLTDGLLDGALAPLAPLADPLAGGFDAPRVRTPGNAFWEVWYAFRQAIITHHNKDFARWITTTPYPDDSGSGVTVPSDRWYSYQIPTDYLFGGTPAAPNFRFVTSASPLLSADVFPYGGMGITAFNTNLGVGATPPTNGPYGRTLAGALPVIEALHRRWAILEWNPLVGGPVPPSSTPDIYRDEMDLVERYRPGLLTPFMWDNLGQTRGTPFETELRNLVQRIKNVPGGCRYSIPSGLPVGASGAFGLVVPVTVSTTAPLTQQECPVTAVTDASWLHVTAVPPVPATGPGLVYFTADANNTSTARVGRITVASFTFTVTQTAATCTYALDAAATSVRATGTTGTVNLTTLVDCAWTAVSNDPSFITITSAGSGVGGASIAYTVAPNTAPTRRSGTMTIGGRTFTVSQRDRRAVAGDFSGDGQADLAVFSPGPGNWSIWDRSVQQWGLPGDVPVPGDYDGDTIEDVAIYRPWSGQWYINGQATVQHGLPGDIPVPADYNGDGRTDTVVYRYAPVNALGLTTNFIFPSGLLPPGLGSVVALGTNGDTPAPADYDGDGKADAAVFRSGLWLFRNSTGNYLTTSEFTFGVPGDVPVPRDYDADGKADMAVYRPSTGQWYIMLTTTNTMVVYVWGLAGDQPVPQDVDGDGADELVVFRPSDGRWWMFNRVTPSATSAMIGAIGDIPSARRPRLPTVVVNDADGDGVSDMTVFRPLDGMWYTRLSAGNFQTTRALQWGLPGDVPVPGDYDGDRIAEVAVFRPSDSLWHIRYSATGFATTQTFQWGLAGDLPQPADYDGDGRTDLAVYRPASGEWYARLSSLQYATFTVTQFGLPGDVPLPADYDGDGRADLAVYRPSTRAWYLKESATGLASVRHIAEPGDVPVAADFNGDGRADFADFTPSNARWLAYDSRSVDNGLIAARTVAFWGVPGDIPVPHDFDGNGVADIAVYRPATGEWFAILSPTIAIVRQWGLPGDLPQ